MLGESAALTERTVESVLIPASLIAITLKS